MSALSSSRAAHARRMAAAYPEATGSVHGAEVHDRCMRCEELFSPASLVRFANVQTQEASQYFVYCVPCILELARNLPTQLHLAMLLRRLAATLMAVIDDPLSGEYVDDLLSDTHAMLRAIAAESQAPVFTLPRRESSPLPKEMPTEGTRKEGTHTMAEKKLPPWLMKGKDTDGDKAPKGGKKVAAKGAAALEKKEERVHKDLDHDGEKGESAAHKAKVMGKSGKKPAKGK